LKELVENALFSQSAPGFFGFCNPLPCGCNGARVSLVLARVYPVHRYSRTEPRRQRKLGSFFMAKKTSFFFGIEKLRNLHQAEKHKGVSGLTA